MSVVSFSEIHNGREGSDTSGDKNVDKYTRVWRAITNSPYDDWAVVKAQAPRRGAQHPNDSRARLKELTGRNEDDSKYIWIVTGSYSTESDDDENPLAEPAKVSWSTTEKTVPAVVDDDGDAVLNSAGDQFLDPPAEVEELAWVATVRKNVATIPDWFWDFGDGRKPINNDSVTIGSRSFTANQLRLDSVEVGEVAEKNDIEYMPVTLKLAYRKSGWKLELIDRGFNEAMEFDGALVQLPATLEDGEKPTQPVLLDGNGLKLAEPSPETAVTLTFYIYHEMAFASLPLR